VSPTTFDDDNLSGTRVSSHCRVPGAAFGDADLVRDAARVTPESAQHSTFVSKLIRSTRPATANVNIGCITRAASPSRRRSANRMDEISLQR
jgi:hypothetical protein